MPGIHCRLMTGPAGSAGRCRRKRGEVPADPGGDGIDGIDGNGLGGHGVARNSVTDGAADGLADDGRGRGRVRVRKAMEVQVQVPSDRPALASGPGKPGLAPGCQS